MKSLGKYPIYFTGSGRQFWRTIYEWGDRYFCKWYGELIRVERGLSGYFYTVDKY